MCAEKDKERTQRHHDELVIAINAGKEELREKRKERGAAADANRKAGYSMHTSCATTLVSLCWFNVSKHLQAEHLQLCRWHILPVTGCTVIQTNVMLSSLS